MLVFSFLMFSCIVQGAKAGMIGTETVVYLAKKEKSQALVTAFLDRKDVQQAMERQGVDVDEARKRVKALSDDELMKIVHKIDQLPAGGDAVGTVVGGFLIVFLVLLLTDILGFTHVFTFVNR